MDDKNSLPIEELIKQTHALSEEKKALFLQAVSSLSPEDINELQKTFDHEHQMLTDIEADAEIKREAIEQEFSQIIDQAFKTHMRRITSEQEEGEKLQSEDILKKLDTV